MRGATNASATLTMCWHGTTDIHNPSSPPYLAGGVVRVVVVVEVDGMSGWDHATGHSSGAAVGEVHGRERMCTRGRLRPRHTTRCSRGTGGRSDCHGDLATMAIATARLSAWLGSQRVAHARDSGNLAAADQSQTSRGQGAARHDPGARASQWQQADHDMSLAPAVPTCAVSVNSDREVSTGAMHAF